ncbi:MAG: hypothetical protein IIZ78_08115 [Clostridiales bacterium]|nr:hypothetical protein [Clostridiales bacterium]
MGKINTDNYPNRPVTDYQDDDMFILQDNGGETYTTNIGDIKDLIEEETDPKLALKVDKNGTDRLMTAAEGTKLAGIATGAQVNVLEGVQVNDSDLPITDKKVNIDITGKADKVTNATSGHLAGLDSNGNLTDSGVSPTEEVTIEGNPVTFESPFEQDAKSVVVSVKPIQDLHGYDHPWPAGGGKNKLPLVLADIKANNTDGTWNGNTYTWNGATFAVNTDDAGNVLSINGTGNGNAGVTLNLFFNLKAGTYIMNSGFVEAQGSNDTLLLVNNVVIARGNSGSPGQTFTLEEDSACHWVFRIATSTTLTCKPMIRLATESDATFAPYSNICPISGIDEVEIGVSDGESEPTTTTIPLPSTLYGGTVDADTGVVTVTHGIVDLGTLDWIYETTYSRFRSTSITDAKIYSQARVAPLWCSAFQPITDGRPFNQIPDNSVYFADDTSYAYVHDSAYTDSIAFKTAMSGVMLCYELATPTTISLTPADVELLEGTNVVSTNAEKVAVTYGRSLWQDIDDLKSDTEGKLNKSDVADVEGDTASKAYAVNDFMLRSDGFYKVTQPIAQNASITSSNTTKTTIGAVLTALLNA